MAYNRPSNYYRPSFFGGFQFFPPVIKGLLISNAAVFLFGVFFGVFRFDGPITINDIIHHYFALWSFESNNFGVWQFFTYMYLHADLFHVFFNMLILWMFGTEVEHVFGSKKFFIYYTICGVGGGILQLIATLFFGVAEGSVIGASGAVYGVLAAFGMLFPNRLIYIYFILPLPAKYIVPAAMIFGIIMGGNNVAHFAHFGGAVVGLFYLVADGYRFRSSNISSQEGESIFSRVAGFGRKQQDVPEYSPRGESNVYDLFEQTKKEEQQAQLQIDDILDKISKNGYQSLTEEEKKILFEASKKLN